MNDPYTTLGVSRNASDEEIKKAYRDLARKYHPDNYHDNPLADLAQEKMKEINEAYDTITKQRASGHSGGYGGSYSGASSGYGASGGYGGYSGSTAFADVRAALNAGNIAQAEALLNAAGTRNAEWNFLMGSVCYRKGWMDEARNYYQMAVNMDPNNAEYRQALNYMIASGQPYRQDVYGAQTGMDMCDVCTALWCANLCCSGCR